MNKNINIGELAYKFIQGALTEDEKSDLENWKTKNDTNRLLFEEIIKESNIYQALKENHPKNRERLKNVIWEKITERLPEIHQRSGRLRRILFLRIAAAFVIIAGGLAFFLFQQKNMPDEIVTESLTDLPAPGKSIATITLSNGKKIPVDSLYSGTLAIESGQKILKLANGQLLYEGENKNENSITIYNTLENPKGSKVIDIVLSDGSHVWLNSGSTLTFPAVFGGSQRKVIIEGEAYLDVAHNAAKPFVVETGNFRIQVVGTGFNVNAYEDDPLSKITLLKGSVRVMMDDSQHLLKPGQQAQIQDRINILNNVNLSSITAWKEGSIEFQSADLKSIMKQIERYYDLEVVFNGDVSDRKFTGSFSRKANLSEVLKIFEASNIHFRLNEKKLTVIL